MSKRRQTHRKPARGKRIPKYSERLGCEVDWTVGRHKKSDSAETKRWEAEHLIPPRPPWMPEETYVKLAKLREE